MIKSPDNQNNQGGDGVTSLCGVYIHIPFCEKKCHYCDFYSLPAVEALMDAYTESVLRALRNASDTGPADTVYFGGGTPNLMGAARLSRLLEAADSKFSLRPGSEITLEANPGALNKEMLVSLCGAGFTRISIGAQSALPSELKLLGRRHDFSDVRNAVIWAHDAGFRHISLDLMTALPGQGCNEVFQSLENMVCLPIDHLSVYLLKREENTPFHNLYPDADPDAAADLYLFTVLQLESHGFYQYEISNFARPGGKSLHNLKYWTLAPYLGIGPSAHSFIRGRRQFFPRSLDDYLAAENPFALWQDDGPGGDAEEYLLLALRLKEGISLKKAAAMGLDAQLLIQRCKALAAEEYIILHGDRLALTPKGFLMSNSVIAYLLQAALP